VGVILDSSILIAFERHVPDAETLVQGREREVVGISVVTAAELLPGSIALIHQRDA
jgi:predicted nucleic acid-binding protein